MHYTKGLMTKGLVWLMAFAMVFCLVPMNTGQVRAASSSDYVSGQVDWYSTFSPGDMIHDSFRYSDSWFEQDPADANQELALASMQLVASAVEEGKDKPAEKFLTEMGFSQTGASGFASTDPEDCAYIWGSKTIKSGGEDCRLLAVAIQSYALDDAAKGKGWKQNFMINGQTLAAEHESFNKAADKAIDEIAALAGTDKVKIWITGQSRGGAIAGMLAAKLPNTLGENNTGIYAYTFESPNTVDPGEDAAAKEALVNNYGYIHNYICSDDIVTMVPPWGMSRYGVSHELKTGETEEYLQEELAALGSKAPERTSDLDDKDLQAIVERILARLTEQVPTREDYSKERTDSFTDANGTPHEITYSYQDTILKLVDVVFSDQLSGIAVDKFLPYMGSIDKIAQTFADGIKKDKEYKEGKTDQNGAADFWKGTEEIYSILTAVLGDKMPWTQEQLYELLRFAAPLIIIVGEDGSADYITMLVSTVLVANDLTYSHHFDTLVARLKILNNAVTVKGTALTKAAGAKKAVKVKWKKQPAKVNGKNITGYQIRVATNKKLTKNAKTVTVKGWKKTAKTIKKLKTGKKYYVKIRTFQTVEGVKYHSAWSKAKTCKVR